MKHFLALILIGMLLLTACSAPGTSSATSPTPADSSKAEVTSSAETSSKTDTSAGEIPAFGEDLILMASYFDDYKSYFNMPHHLREFPYAVGLYTLKDGAIYLDASYLNLTTANGETADDILFYNGHKIGTCKFTDMVIYFAEENGTDLYRLDTTTRETALVYHSNSVIENISGDDRCIIFCCADGGLYRTFALTGETYQVYKIPMYEDQMGWFVAWDDTLIEISYACDEKSAENFPEELKKCQEGFLDNERKEGAAFLFNCRTREIRGMSSDEYYERRNYCFAGE